MIKGLFVLGLAMSLVVAPDLHAQDADDAPGAVAVSYWKCSYANFGDTIALMNDVPRTVWDELVAEGMLADFGILTHQWGDEWNLVFYTVGSDAAALLEASGEYFRRVNERDPDGALNAQFTEACTEHKDNIYSIVQPPDGSADDDM